MQKKSDVDAELSNKEPSITAGSNTQYWRGDKTFQTLNTDAVPETASRVFLSPAQKTIATQAASSTVNGYLSSADWSTFNGKQNALADVITANTYGSSTQYPVITFNAKGIATGVTLQTVPTPTFTDATFSVQQDGSPSIAATWDLTALTASAVHTYPNKDIDFKALSSIGASDSNTLSGTRNRILGGNNNTVSGTDNIAIGCTGLSSNINGSRNIVIGGRNVETGTLTDKTDVIVLGGRLLALVANGSIVEGRNTALHPRVGCRRTRTKLSGILNDTAQKVTSNSSATSSKDNCVPAIDNLVDSIAMHEFDILARRPSAGVFCGKRRVIVQGVSGSASIVQTLVVGTDYANIIVPTISFAIENFSGQRVLVLAVSDSSGLADDGDVVAEVSSIYITG